MKKQLITIFVGMFVLCVSASAQYTYIQPELAIGTNQGVAIWTTVGFSPTVVQNFDVRYNGGFTIRYIIQKHFGIQGELNYAQRGWSETSLTGERYDHRFDYLEIPLVAHIYFGKEKFRFFINLGPKFRYMINDYATEHFSSNYGKQQTKAIENRFDYSVFGGLGIEFRTKKAGYFQLEARYDYGFGNVYSSRKGEDFSSSNNTAITIGITYLYNVLGNKQKK